jgi:hypothetical protein
VYNCHASCQQTGICLFRIDPVGMHAAPLTTVLLGIKLSGHLSHTNY